MSDEHKEAISKLAYAVSEKFGVGMYDSCRDVQNPSSGKHALDMLCGDASKCNPQYWLKFLSDNSPFPIDFILTSNDSTLVPGTNVTLQPMRSHIEPCSESCSCQDCRSQCPPVPPDIPPSHWTILGYDAMYVIMACIFAAFVIVFVLAHIWTWLYCAEGSSSNYIVNGDLDTLSLVSSSSTTAAFCKSCGRLQAKFQHLLSAVFAAWGRFCARWPWSVVVIVVSYLVCAVLMAGIARVGVVTDPVELWSAPDSRARVEKNYFDNNFG